MPSEQPMKVSTNQLETTVFCLPFAGGGSHSYREFQRHAGSGIRIVALDLPGRGRRFSEPLLTSLEAVVDDAFEQIRDRLTGNYAIYGHSMGACIACMLVRHIIREQYPPPVHLFVSGREAPSVPKKGERNRHLLPRSEFLARVREFEGATEEVMGNQELMDLFEPVLRADFQVLDTHVYEKELPFGIPITAMRGDKEHVTRAEALRWQEETTQEMALLEFPGGHFFIFDNAREIVDVFTRKVLSSFDIAV